MVEKVLAAQEREERRPAHYQSTKRPDQEAAPFGALQARFESLHCTLPPSRAEIHLGQVHMEARFVLFAQQRRSAAQFCGGPLFFGQCNGNSEVGKIVGVVLFQRERPAHVRQRHMGTTAPKQHQTPLEFTPGSTVVHRRLQSPTILDGHWGKATGQKVRLGLRSKDRLPHAAQSLIDLTYIKRFGIEIAANPFREFSVLRVGGISHCLEKIFVAAQSPHVFRGTRASPRQANRIPDALLGRKRRFYHKDVLPVVAKIVVVGERCARSRYDLAQGIVPFVFRLAPFSLVLAGYAVILAADDELAQMGICPPHDALQDSVESGERDIASHLDAPPDRRPRAAERHLDLVDLNPFCHGPGHGYTRAWPILYLTVDENHWSIII